MVQTSPKQLSGRAPRVGELVLVRSRRWLVDEVIEPTSPGQTCVARLSCADDDAQGQTLELLWDYEVDRQILEEEGWADLAAKGFDQPRHFAAFLHTLRWNCVTATDPNLFQAPFRAGIKIDAYQMEPLRKALRLPRVKRVLRQAWELDDADKAEKLIRNLAQRLERDWSGVSGSILEGIDEILTVTRLGLPKELRRSLACTNVIENVMGTVRRVCRNVKRWRSASMAMRWTAAAMQEAAKGFRRLKAHKQLPALRVALETHRHKKSHGVLASQANAA